MIGSITGVLASRNASATVEQYYTTAIYPVLAPDDSATISTPEIISGELAQYYTSVLYPIIYEDSATTGVVEVGKTELWSYPEEQLNQGTPTLLSGTLQETIAYKTYNNGLPEELTQSTPSLLYGTLVTTISYITYNNGAVEELTQSTPTLISGTLI